MNKPQKDPATADPAASPRGQAPGGNPARRAVKQLAAELSDDYADYAPPFLRRE